MVWITARASAGIGDLVPYAFKVASDGGHRFPAVMLLTSVAAEECMVGHGVAAAADSSKGIAEAGCTRNYFDERGLDTAGAGMCIRAVIFIVQRVSVPGRRASERGDALRKAVLTEVSLCGISREDFGHLI